MVASRPCRARGPVQRLLDGWCAVQTNDQNTVWGETIGYDDNPGQRAAAGRNIADAKGGIIIQSVPASFMVKYTRRDILRSGQRGNMFGLT